MVNAAGSLLTLVLEHGRENLAAERRVRSAVLRLLLAGEMEAGRQVLELLGDRLPDGPLTVLAAGGDPEAVLEAAGEEFAAVADGRVVAVVPAARADAVAAALAGHGPVGVGAPAAPEELRTGFAQADRALAAARRGAEPVMRFSDLAGQGLLALLDAEAAEAFSAALLAPCGSTAPARTCWNRSAPTWRATGTGTPRPSGSACTGTPCATACAASPRSWAATSTTRRPAPSSGWR
nr:hypothetical protein GCM10020093_101140 [Planobispora longispora]